MQRGKDRRTDTQTRVTNIHFASAAPYDTAPLMLTRYVLSSCVRLSVCKHRIMSTTPHKRAYHSSFLTPKISAELQGSHHYGGIKCRWSRLKSTIFYQYFAIYLRNDERYGIYTWLESKKGRHYNLARNFVTCSPIFPDRLISKFVIVINKYPAVL